MTLFVALFFASCAPMSNLYYQVYTVVPDDNMNIKDDKICYEDENCSITYYLWDDGGDLGFYFANKTDENIYINMKECFLIKNDMAYDYFQNRTYTKTTSNASSSSIALGMTNLSTDYNNVYGRPVTDTYGSTLSGATQNVSYNGLSVTYYEKDIITIPAKSIKWISGYKIKESVYRDCNLILFPYDEKKIRTSSFSKEDTPLEFTNRIAYYLGDSEQLIRIEHNFYISDITNYPDTSVRERRPSEFCGEKDPTLRWYFKFKDCNKFYIKYDYNGFIYYSH